MLKTLCKYDIIHNYNRSYALKIAVYIDSRMTIVWRK